MVTLVIGGAGSGKSDMAENIISSYKSKYLIYVATMKVYDEEGKEKVKRHKKMRKDKGFTHVYECLNNFSDFEIQRDGDVLIDCLSNLCAGEMFQDDGSIKDSNIVTDIIVSKIKEIISYSKNVVIVANDIFGDGLNYDKTTKEYMKALGDISFAISKLSDNIIESVFSIPVYYKRKEECKC